MHTDEETVKDCVEIKQVSYGATFGEEKGGAVREEKSHHCHPSPPEKKKPSWGD